MVATLLTIVPHILECVYQEMFVFHHGKRTSTSDHVQEVWTLADKVVQLLQKVFLSDAVYNHSPELHFISHYVMSKG